MFRENEIITLLLAVGILVFIGANRRRLARLPGFPLLGASYLAFTAGWTFTMLEHLFLPVFFNAMEHACYCAGNVLAACWCWKRVRTRTSDYPK